jgi:hypothetical protein
MTPFTSPLPTCALNTRLEPIFFREEVSPSPNGRRRCIRNEGLSGRKSLGRDHSQEIAYDANDVGDVLRVTRWHAVDSLYAK